MTASPGAAFLDLWRRLCTVQAVSRFKCPRVCIGSDSRGSRAFSLEFGSTRYLGTSLLASCLRRMIRRSHRLSAEVGSRKTQICGSYIPSPCRRSFEKRTGLNHQSNSLGDHGDGEPREAFFCGEKDTLHPRPQCRFTYMLLPPDCSPRSCMSRIRSRLSCTLISGDRPCCNIFFWGNTRCRHFIVCISWL